MASVLLIIGVINSPATELTPPEFHADVSLQSIYYFDEDDRIPYLSSSSDKIEVRHAAIEAIGKLGEYLEYNTEIGLATCPGSSSSGTLTLMDAGIFFKPYSYLKIGFSKGHIMRGFELYEECIDVLTAEKPRFKTIFPCHPIGALIEADYAFENNIGIHAQLTFNTGNGSTMEGEHDINLGVQISTPLKGFSVGGFYNNYQWKVSEYDSDIGDFVATSYDGNRIGFGIDYDERGINLRGEYLLINGYTDSDPIRTYTNGTDTLDTWDVESRAFFIEGGYRFDLKSEMIPYILPYAMYQSWDKASNADGDNKLTYLTAGIAIGVGSEEAELKIDYEMPLRSPDDTYDEAKKLIVRLTGGF